MIGYQGLGKVTTVEGLKKILESLPKDAVIKISFEDSHSKKEKIVAASGMLFNDKEVVIQTEEA